VRDARCTSTIAAALTDSTAQSSSSASPAFASNVSSPRARKRCTAPPARDWTDPSLPFDQAPAALIPLVGTTGAFQASIDGRPAPIAGTYVAVGLTDSTLTVNNLETSAGVWLLVTQGPALNNVDMVYELRLNGRTGPLLATGTFSSVNFNQIAVRYDPATGQAGASINGTDVGSYPAGLSAAPKFVGFEGVGTLDNFVVRALP